MLKAQKLHSDNFRLYQIANIRNPKLINYFEIFNLLHFAYFQVYFLVISIIFRPSNSKQKAWRCLRSLPRQGFISNHYFKV